MAQDHKNNFTHHIGDALTNWQDVESRLFMLMAHILNCHPQFTSVLFFHIKSPDAKVRLLDNLVREAFGEKIKETWKPILTEATRLVIIRNRLAHFEIDSTNPKKLLLREPSFQFADIHKSDNPMSQRDIMQASIDFLSLSISLEEFVEAQFPNYASSKIAVQLDSLLKSGKFHSRGNP